MSSKDLKANFSHILYLMKDVALLKHSTGIRKVRKAKKEIRIKLGLTIRAPGLERIQILLLVVIVKIRSTSDQSCLLLLFAFRNIYLLTDNVGFLI